MPEVKVIKPESLEAKLRKAVSHAKGQSDKVLTLFVDALAERDDEIKELKSEVGRIKRHLALEN